MTAAGPTRGLPDRSGHESSGDNLGAFSDGIALRENKSPILLPFNVLLFATADPLVSTPRSVTSVDQGTPTDVDCHGAFDHLLPKLSEALDAAVLECYVPSRTFSRAKPDLWQHDPFISLSPVQNGARGSTEEAGGGTC